MSHSVGNLTGAVGSNASSDRSTGSETTPQVVGFSGDNTVRINGWQRLWLVASILWAVVILVLAGDFQSDGDQTVPSANAALFVVRLWIVPVGVVYGFGLGLAWVRRGFQLESK
jgi:hypothetical protein